MTSPHGSWNWGALGAEDVRKAEADGWRFDDRGTQLANGFLVFCHHEPTDTRCFALLACPEDYPEAWPELAPKAPDAQLELL